jgi:hypothetical protein
VAPQDPPLLNGFVSVFDDARPGSFDAAEVAREFREFRCCGIMADGLACAVQIEAAHFAERKPNNQF